MIVCCSFADAEIPLKCKFNGFLFFLFILFLYFFSISIQSPIGSKQTDSSGNKQTLKISIEPFNISETKSLKLDKSKIFLPEPNTNDKPTTATVVTKASVTITGNDERNGTETTRSVENVQSYSPSTTKLNTARQRESSSSVPPPKIIVEEMKSKITTIDPQKEKSLLEEISETLMSKQIDVSKNDLNDERKSEDVSNCEMISSDSNNKIKIKNPESVVTSSTAHAQSTEASQITKRSIQRNTGILKDKEKPKIHVFPKHTDSDSDLEFSTVSEYCDLIEAKNIEIKSQVDVVDAVEMKTESSSSPQTKHTNFPAHYKPVIEEFKRRSESYNLLENTFMSSKITSDGLIVTFDDDSTESSFGDDSSHDDNKSVDADEFDTTDKTSATDYEIIELSGKSKNRYCPDGRSDPDGSSETSPQNVVDVQSSKPKVPSKPLRVNNVKPYQKQNAKIIMQLQQVMNKEKSLSTDSLDASKTTVLKKNRAPEPPEQQQQLSSKTHKNDGPLLTFKDLAMMKNKFTANKTNTIQVKEPRTYPALNPKFRSLNNLNKSHETQEKIKSFENLTNSPSSSPPRPGFSLSQDSLIVDLAKVKKNKFSIKKMLRSFGGGSNNKADLSSKNHQQYADIPTSPGDSEYYDQHQTKPRLIIIHPLDINNTGVEVVKSTKSISMLNNDVTTTLDLHLPPPRPETIMKSEKKILPAIPPMKVISEKEISVSAPKGKAPSPLRETGKIYANLGEVRSSIAPKKPERTNSLKDREAKALYLQRHQPVGSSSSSDSSNQQDIISNDDEKCKSVESIIARPAIIHDQDNSATNNSNKQPLFVDTKNNDSVSFSEMKKKIVEIENVSTRSKIELFENTTAMLKKDSPVCRMPLIKPPPISFSPTTESDVAKVAPLKIQVVDHYATVVKGQPMSPISPLSPCSADELSSSSEMRRGVFSPIMPAVTTAMTRSSKSLGSHDDNALYSPVQDIGKLSHFFSFILFFIIIQTPNLSLTSLTFAFYY